MADSEKTAAMLLDDLAAINPPQRREVAAALRTVAETLADVPDGRNTTHALRMLAHARLRLTALTPCLSPSTLRSPTKR